MDKPRMSMKIAEQKNLLFQNLFDVAEKAFRVKDFRVNELAWISPAPVQILAG